MRKLPQDFAFPLGLGTKRYQEQNGDGPLPNTVENHIANADGESTSNHSASVDNTNRRSSQDLDTINL